MSKMDELRAMREAKYARAQGSPRKAAAARPVPVAPPPPKAAATTGAPTTGTDTETGLCGHRSINGRTCTREAGHTAKNHRYS